MTWSLTRAYAATLTFREAETTNSAAGHDFDIPRSGWKASATLPRIAGEQLMRYSSTIYEASKGNTQNGP